MDAAVVSGSPRACLVSCGRPCSSSEEHPGRSSERTDRFVHRQVVAFGLPLIPAIGAGSSAFGLTFRALRTVGQPSGWCGSVFGSSQLAFGPAGRSRVGEVGPPSGGQDNPLCEQVGPPSGGRDGSPSRSVHLRVVRTAHRAGRSTFGWSGRLTGQVGPPSGGQDGPPGRSVHLRVNGTAHRTNQFAFGRALWRQVPACWQLFGVVVRGAPCGARKPSGFAVTP